MNYILVDDNQLALALLADAIKCSAWIDSAKDRLTLVFPSKAEETPESALNTITTELAKQYGCTADDVLRRPTTREELAGIITSSKDCMSVLISDLSMKVISLGADSEAGNWRDPKGEVVKAVKTFVASRGNIAFLHSGGVDKVAIALAIDPSKAKVRPLTTAFENKPSDERAKEMVAEIFKHFGKTPLELLWSDSKTDDWFGGKEAIEHDFDESKSTGCSQQVCQVVGNVIPSNAYTESFHESLKALAGTCFAGSYRRGDTRYPLRLGSIALIASIALHSAHNAGDAVGSKPDLTPFWKQMPKCLAKRGFLANEDPMTNRRVAVGFYWAFYKLFDRSHSMALVGIEVMEDGFRLTFDWKTKPLFDSLMSKAATVPHEEKAHEGTDDYPRPENTTAALLSVQRWLGFSPGCIVRLSSEYSIDILSPSPKGLSTRSEVS